jgi:hypothetical protein
MIITMAANLTGSLPAMPPLCDHRYYSTGQTSQNRTGQSLCEPGYYCLSGVRTACPGGTFGNAQGLKTPACSGPCTAGYYCPAGSTTSTAYACGSGAVHPAAYYCPSGSGSPTLVSSGYYSTPTTAATTLRTGQVECAAADYCLNGVAAPYISWKSCPATLGVWELSAPAWAYSAYFTAISRTKPTQNVTISLRAGPWDFTKSMVGRYPLEQGFNDTAAYGYHAQGKGAFSFSPTIYELGAYSLKLSGAGYVSIPTTDLAATAGTIAWWYQPTTAASVNLAQGLLQLGNKCRAADHVDLSIEGGVIYLRVGGVQLGKVSASSTPYTANKWSQWALTWNTTASSLRLYVDQSAYIAANTCEPSAIPAWALIRVRTRPVGTSTAQLQLIVYPSVVLSCASGLLSDRHLVCVLVQLWCGPRPPAPSPRPRSGAATRPAPPPTSTPRGRSYSIFPRGLWARSKVR